MTFGPGGATIDRFIDWLGSRSAEQLERALRLLPRPRPADVKAAQRQLLVVRTSAAANQSLNKSLRDMWSQSDARDVLGADFIVFADAVELAGRAVLVRHRLAPETFDLIVRPFRDAGFDFDQEA
ncbi:hypothetical protein ELQ92_14255 [Labedella populi]|uniref:Uncharacterized protein n=1 Tax=Labedella populi TaxID=2498850 RepID=A0A444Q3Z1_9MICO|nr:hypothetical protein [Labedella populi]RWZ58464.1 hypothetical protein ELQ92_14255 [Labedella populi]